MLRPPDLSAMDLQGMIEREWLDTNGLGGYASSTLCGLNTRKYHGLLVAAMSPPARRMVLLSQVDETVITSAGAFSLSTNEYPGAINPQGYRLLRAFNAAPFPRWAFQGDGFTIEKSLHLLEGENTLCLTYSLLAGDQSISLEVRPLMALRGIHELTYQWNGRLGAEAKSRGQIRIAATARTPEVFFAHDAQFQSEPYWYLNSLHRREADRGYGGLEDLWNPGVFRWKLVPGQTCHLICSAEPVEMDRVCCDLDRVRSDADKRAAVMDIDQSLDSLIRAARAFVVSGPVDPQNAPQVQVISQYPWSNAGGRTALIAFAGLFLISGRFDEGRQLLEGLAGQLREGLIPTDFSETCDPPQYNGADTSLWFINAVGEYLRYSQDEAGARGLLPSVETIIESYSHGTRLGINVGTDGLISTRAPGAPTSWMDAKVGQWLVTPREGCTVELNALWFNALSIASNLSTRFGNSALARKYDSAAQLTQQSFNKRFWCAPQNCCFDVIEGPGDDGAIRPNQLLAISLQYSVLNKDRHQAVLQTVLNDLLTPMGVRTLSPRDAAYQPRYGGDVTSRDRAQHQGSAYPWLLGPLVTAHVRANGRNSTAIAQARAWLEPCLARLLGDGLGQLGELFDGNSPQRPGGAIASALSVGELLRCYAQDILGQEPAPRGKPDARVMPAPPTQLSTIPPK